SRCWPASDRRNRSRKQPEHFVQTGLGMPIVERRRRRSIEDADWRRLTGHTGLIPLAALLGGRWRPAETPSPPRLAIALAVWVGLWLLHQPVIGAWPGP
ncbi:MAG: hypothetical protein JNK88_10990, partial [Mangrovicoccus sp.]|nr:hypothetical protein [Mangrovicoccus sp.]